MRRVWKTGSLGLSAAAVAALALALPASAAITSSAVTTPSTSPLYMMYNEDSPNTIAISGTTDSTAPATDKVDIRCFYGSPAASKLVAAGVSLAGDGSFSLPAATVLTFRYQPCRLRAVPAGSTTNSNNFRGPLLVTGDLKNYKIAGGPNDGTTFDYYIYGQQLRAADDFRSLGLGGLWDAYLYDDAYGYNTDIFYANAFLWQGTTGDTRSYIQVDGQDAYASAAAAAIVPRSGVCPPACDGSQDNSGFPTLTFSVSQSASTGNVTIHESDPIARCPSGTAYPPTHATCSAFTATGVKVEREITQDHDGHIVWITDNFSATDAHTHTLDLLYGNAQYLGGILAPNIGYLFPGQSGYAARSVGDTLTVPKRPGSVYVKGLHADDGDPFVGQGALTYATAPTEIKFHTPRFTTVSSDFTMRYQGTVPASGALTYKFGYSIDATSAGVAGYALEVQHSFTPCKVPKLKGKTVKQGKQALTKAYCKLGKVKKAKSKTVKKGRIISSRPGAGATKPFGTLVDVKVSRGKK